MNTCGCKRKTYIGKHSDNIKVWLSDRVEFGETRVLFSKFDQNIKIKPIIKRIAYDKNQKYLINSGNVFHIQKGNTDRIVGDCL